MFWNLKLWKTRKDENENITMEVILHVMTCGWFPCKKRIGRSCMSKYKKGSIHSYALPSCLNEQEKELILGMIDKGWFGGTYGYDTT